MIPNINFGEILHLFTALIKYFKFKRERQNLREENEVMEIIVVLRLFNNSICLWFSMVNMFLKLLKVNHTKKRLARPMTLLQMLQGYR